jgi:glycosyltransferase involved in cell wall biosynthesis
VNAADVTVIIPTIPSRRHILNRAFVSVLSQFHPVDNIIIATDHKHEGSAAMRNRALKMVQTTWVAFLDDDDEFMSNHIDELIACTDNDVDVVYTGCVVLGPDGKVIPQREEWGRYGQPFDADLLRDHSWLPVTSLCRTSLAQQANFDPYNGTDYDDWGFYLSMLDLGARFHHHPVVTWIWHHHGANTSGRGDRW